MAARTGRLDGKIALITGGAMGMGASHARAFAEEGARVVVADINDAEGERIAADLGPTAHFLHLDVADPNSWDDALERTEMVFGPVTVLVNNAGVVGPAARTVEVLDADYERTISIDQHGVFYGMRAAIPSMIASGGGSIVNISSVAGFAHVPGCPNLSYTTAKFAVRGMTKAAAVEYAKDNVRVNSIHPGTVLTPMMRAAMDDATIAKLVEHVPMGRLADLREMSAAVLFLASDDASYITGTELVVDGGWMAT